MMSLWRKHPTIYEINTWVWLNDLSRRHGHEITLANVPDVEWDAMVEFGFDSVWLMGVWKRSPTGRQIAREQPDLLREYRRALPDVRPEDVVGSPYSVPGYFVDPHLGGPEGLAAARKALAARGVRLLLDFVPNHIARDHPWVTEHPEYLIQGRGDDLNSAPEFFFRAGNVVLAHGRDPNFPAWTDTAQVNAFHPGLRRAYAEVMESVAEQCDGVRCDMAMLLINRIFAETWGEKAGDEPTAEFWQELIRVVRARHPGFFFLAEAYWDTEQELCDLGFDCCYDKRLYDLLILGDAERVRERVRADIPSQDCLVRFIENHDQPRAAAIFAAGKAQAAAVIAATLPGARLFHQGQLEGRRVQLPVQLGRCPPEPVDRVLQNFYRELLREVSASVFHEGIWNRCEVVGWPDNPSWRNLMSWCWRLGEERRLVVVNYSEAPSQGRVRAPWDDLGETPWNLRDVLSGDRFTRDGGEVEAAGLYVGLPAYGVHVFRVETET